MREIRAVLDLLRKHVPINRPDQWDISIELDADDVNAVNEYWATIKDNDLNTVVGEPSLITHAE